MERSNMVGDGEHGEELEDSYPKVWQKLETSLDMEGEPFDALRLWKNLPKELFHEVLAKLPFESLVRWRSVSKHWKSIVIPRAAEKVGASKVSALLYIDDSRKSDARSREELTPSYFHLGDSKSGWTSRQDFSLSCTAIPTPTVHENVKLVVSKGGLLGFCYIHSLSEDGLETVTNFVVCNPVLGQSRTIGLPPGFLQNRRTLVGIIIYAETQSFKFVVAYRWDPLLLVYDSRTRVWKNSLRFRSGESKQILGERREFVRFVRSVSFRGNLYWFESSGFDTFWVLEYVMNSNRWNRILVGESKACSEDIVYNGIVGNEEAVLVLHICCPRSDYSDVERHRENCAIRETSNVRLQPAIKLMDPVMVENTEWHLFQELNGATFKFFRSYGQNNFVFHVMTHNDSEGMASYAPSSINPRIIVCDTSDNSYKTLQLMERNLWPRGSFNYLRTITDMVWPFSPSLMPLA